MTQIQNWQLAFHFCFQLISELRVNVTARNVEHIISISKILEINRNPNVNSLFVWRSRWGECVLATISIQNMKWNQHYSVNWCGFCHEIDIEIEVDSITSDKYWCFVVNTVHGTALSFEYWAQSMECGYRTEIWI